MGFPPLYSLFSNLIEVIESWLEVTVRLHCGDKEADAIRRITLEEQTSVPQNTMAKERGG